MLIKHGKVNTVLNHAWEEAVSGVDCAGQDQDCQGGDGARHAAAGAPHDAAEGAGVQSGSGPVHG